MTPTEARALADLADGPLFKHTVAVALRSLADQVEALEKNLRIATTHANNYRWLRDHSGPENCVYYLCSDQTQARFNDPSEVDKRVATDIANNEAFNRAKNA